MKQAIERLGKVGATRYVIDLRGSARGDIDEGVAAARLFVKSGTLTIRQSKNDQREVTAAAAGDGSVTAPVALLPNGGTSTPKKIFWSSSHH